MHNIGLNGCMQGRATDRLQWRLTARTARDYF